MEFKAKKDGKEYGPYSFEEIYALVQSGKFKETDLTWNSITKQWQTVGEAIPIEKQDILVHKDGQQYGPYTLPELYSLIEVGDYNRDTDLAWREGMTEWRPVGEIAPPDDTDEIIKMYSDGETEEDIMKMFSDDPTEEREVTTPSLPQSTNKEDHTIDVIGSAVCLIYQSYFRLLGQVVKHMVEELDNQKRPILKRNIVCRNITKLYSSFFGLTEWLESDGMDSLAKTIINETQVDDVRDTPYTLISSDLRSHGLESFVALRDDLQQAMDSLGVEHESISVVQSAATGAAAGAAITFLAAKGKHEGKGAVAGAVVGAGVGLARKGQIRREMFTHGLGCCMGLLKELYKLTTGLFDQTILLCLPKRPTKNPMYIAVIKQLDEELKVRLINEGVFLLGFFEILLGKIESQIQLNAARNGLGIMIVLIIALGTMVSSSYNSDSVGDPHAIWYVLFVIFILPVISACRKIVRSHKDAEGFDEVMKQFRAYVDSSTKQTE